MSEEKLCASAMDLQNSPLLSQGDNSEDSVDESPPGSGSSSSEIGLLPEPEPKRQRIDEGGDGDEVTDEDADSGSEDEDEDEDEDEEDDDDEEEEMVWTQTPSKRSIDYPEDEEGQRKFHLFYKQIAASEGFDFDEVPPVDVIWGGVLPVNMNSAFHGPKVRECVQFVIEEHNADHRGVLELHLDEIVKSNYGAVNGINYYITFKATDTLSSDPANATKVYQAEIYRQRDGTKETTLFREKGQTIPIREEEDRPRTCL